MGFLKWIADRVWEDETATLESAVAKLHDEVMRLRRENDKLRKSEAMHHEFVRWLREISAGSDCL